MPRAGPPTVVIVEDEEVVSLFLRECLCEADFQVRTFPDAETALQVADNLLIDAAVIDVGLPHQTGDELTRQGRARHPNLAIILATGYDESRFQQIFASDARTRILAKPSIFRDFCCNLMPWASTRLCTEAPCGLPDPELASPAERI